MGDIKKMNIKVTYHRGRKAEEKEFSTYAHFGKWCVDNAANINITKVLVRDRKY